MKANWNNAAQDALFAAREIKHYSRSSVSRAYFAAYSAAAYALVQSGSVAFQAGREGPRHADILKLIQNHLGKQLGNKKIKLVLASIRRLRQARIDADYRMSICFSSSDTLKVLQDAALVLKELL